MEKVEIKPWIHQVSKDPWYEGIRKTNPDAFETFKSGKTGFPFVDACIRFLNWKDVGQFLAQQWIDYEPGIHWSQIQMQAGLIPPRHIPIYDVIKQSKENDPKGDFIRQNVLELAHLSAEEIHEPWKLNSNPYYEPMIDYESTLQSSKETLYPIKKEPERKPNV